MLKRTKVALVAGTAVLALAGIGTGAAFAAGSTSSSTPAPSGGATPATSTAPAKHHPGLLARTEHGQVTVRTKQGDQTLDLQHGQVTSVSATSITVRSRDGFTATYTVNGNAKVRKEKQASSISNVSTGDRVEVVAVHSGTTDTVRRIADAGPAPTK
jgi:hypothetical protein